MPKINRKLTDTEIRNAKPRDKDYKLYDEGGLRLLIRKTGTKVWQVRFKIRNRIQQKKSKPKLLAGDDNFPPSRNPISHKDKPK